MKKTALTLVALALAFTTACGGNDEAAKSSRPSEGDVAKSLTSKTSTLPIALSENQAECVAKILVSSKLSDKTLKAFVKQDPKYKGSDAEAKILSDLAKTIDKNCQIK